MDFHKLPDITTEQVKSAHIADLTVQDKYGVKYHQFWVNEKAGTVFCLMEGPDKESCEAVHREAQGVIACAMVEVEPGFYESIMGKGHLIDHGLVLEKDGSADLGFRNIMVVIIQGITSITHSQDSTLLSTPHEARKLVSQKTAEFNGRKVEWLSDEGQVSVFSSSSNAVLCAQEIRHALSALKKNDRMGGSIIFRIGVSAGQPVTENSEFFEEAIKLAHRLCNVAEDNQIIISSLVNDLREKDAISNEAIEKSFKLMNASDETFITSLFSATEGRLADEHFTVETLSREIGISRPQLYRKIISLTGRSPNDLLRDLRMEKARSLLRQKSRNISEVALEVGYNNPSYFAKCFAKKFGCNPSKFAEVAISF